MSYVLAAPDLLATAGTNVTGIGASLKQATAAAAAPTDGAGGVGTGGGGRRPRRYRPAPARPGRPDRRQTIVDDVLGVINFPTDLAVGRPLIGNIRFMLGVPLSWAGRFIQHGELAFTTNRLLPH